MCGQLKFIVIISLALFLHGCAQRTEPAPVKRLYQGKTIHDFEPASLKAESYQVEPGDTLYSIAFRANEDVRNLARWNAIEHPYIIFPGQKIVLSEQARSNTQSVASDTKKGYREQRVKQKLSKPLTSKQQSATPVARVPVPRSEPRLPASNEIVWQWPAQGTVIGEFSTAESGRKGIDIGGAEGSAVQAAAAGKVVYAGNALKGYGQLIILKHNDDYITAYAHNQKLLVKEQQWVNKGDDIATMGDTDAERVKLQFQVRFRGKSVNPRHYLPRGRQ